MLLDLRSLVEGDVVAQPGLEGSGGYVVWPPSARPPRPPPPRKVGGSLAELEIWATGLGERLPTDLPVVLIAAAGSGLRRVSAGRSVRLAIRTRAGGRPLTELDDAQVFEALEAFDARDDDEERLIDII